MRYAFVLGITAALVAGWNAWVVFHDDGIVRGRVVDAAGRPATGAVVRFWEKTLTTLEARASTGTGPDGAFVFTGPAAHIFAFHAEQRRLCASPRTLYRRYFRDHTPLLTAPTTLR